MGEWSEYFEDFPEENPGNYVGNRFDPAGAVALRHREARLLAEQQRLDDEIKAVIQKHQPQPDRKT